MTFAGKEELKTCKHFLMDSEMENGRHRVYNFAMDTLDPKCLLENLDIVFDCLKGVAKLNVAFGFVLKYVEDGSCRHYYAHENKTLLEKSKLVGTTEDLTKITKIPSNTDVIESCTKEGTNTKMNLYKLTNVTYFAPLLKEVPMGCIDTLLQDPLLKIHSVKCSTIEENTRSPYSDILYVFRTLAIHLHGNDRLEEETSKLLNLFLEKSVWTDPANFQCVCMEEIAAVEDIVQADIFLYDIDIVEVFMIGEIARRSVGKHYKTVRLFRYNSHVCHVSHINVLFKAFLCPSCNKIIERAYHLERHLKTCQ